MSVNSHAYKLQTLKNDELIDFVSNFTSEEILTYKTDILYALYNLPKWNNNVRFINIIVTKMSEETTKIIFKDICEMWSEIGTHYKDKFLYLLFKLGKNKIIDIINSDLQLEIKCYILRNIELKEEEIDHILEYSINGDIAILKVLVDKIKEREYIDKKIFIGHAKQMKNLYKKRILASLINDI